MLGIFKARRETNPPTAHAWDPIDSDRDAVVVTGAIGIPDPIRQSDFPARPAMVQIAHTGLRADWSQDQSPHGHHVEIDYVSGRPRGRQAAWTERVNIATARAANFGLQYEVDEDPQTEDDALATLMGV